MDSPSIIDASKNGDVERLKELLLEDVDLDLRDEKYGQTAISWASEKGELEVVKILLEKHAKINIADNNGLLPLYWAYSNEHNETAKLLLDSTTKQQDILHRDGYGRTALSYAAMCGAADVIPRLLSTPDIEIDSRDQDGLTPLMFAASHGHEEASRLLLNANADPFLKDEEGRDALYYAASKGHVATMRILLKTNPDCIRFNGPKSDDPQMMVAAAFAVAATGIDDTWKALPDRSQYLAAQDSAGFTALHHAANFGLLDAVRYLVNDGSKVDALDGMGRSPLILASIAGFLPTVQFLLNERADVNLKDEPYKQTPLMFAAENGRDDVVQYLCTRDDVDVNDIATGWREYTALIIAVINGSSGIVKTLLKPETDLEKVDSMYGQSALSWATELGHIDVAKLLIQAGADLYSSNNYGQSPALLAAMASPEMFKVCVKEPGPVVAGTEPLPRARAIETGLRYACESDNQDILDLILGSDEYLNAQDQNQRSVLSLASENGNKTEMEKLCGKSLDFNLRDNSGRTPLSWAAANGSEKCVSLLLKHSDDPDLADSNRRTPLSWAAGEGHLSAVKELLAHRLDKKRLAPSETGDDNKTVGELVSANMSRPTQEAAVRSKAKTTKGKTKTIEVNSLDSKLWTPLCHAAFNGRKTVVEILLSHGADPTITVMGDIGNGTIVEHLIHMKHKLERDAETGSASGVADSKAEPAALDAVLQILVSSEPLRTRPLEEATDVDRQFSATVVKIPKGEESDMRFAMLSVESLLRQGLPKHLNGDDSCRWLHLPANNMTWVEILMARHFESAGEEESWKRNIVLKPKLWSGQQHTSWNKAYHARFMRPACHSFALSQSRTNAESLRSKPNSKGVVLFMPYLHWDLEEEIEKLKKVLKKKFFLLGAPETMKVQDAKAMVKKAGLNGTEKLYWMYLDQKSPLHVRRTLDQFYYHTMPNTDERDRDQTALRHFRKQEESEEHFKPVLTMVDQLWMWVLPEIGRSPPTVITAFPQRCNRMTSSTSKNMTVLVGNIIERAQELAVRTSGELAEVIASECSRIYLDATSDRKPPIQFLEIYNTSIGDITDRETQRFQDFQKNIRSKETTGVTSQGRDPEALKKMIDIENDIEDLRQIKDIREELSIMSSLFHVQKEVLLVMDHAIRDEIDPVHQHPHLFPEFFTPTRSLSTSSSSAVDVKERASQSQMLMAVDRSIETVQRLEEYAERAATSIQQLLDLKNKQATLLQEQLARKLTVQTGKQGNTIMWFTVTTIIFLPLSFMASFLALEVSEFPWSNDKLSLSFVLQILCE
ncbi:hypothetical protein Neosp_013372 [[Neocosmospora] mangrovei]